MKTVWTVVAVWCFALFLAPASVNAAQTAPEGFVQNWLILGQYEQPGGAAPGVDNIRADYLRNADGSVNQDDLIPANGLAVNTDIGGAAASTGFNPGDPANARPTSPQIFEYIDGDEQVNFNTEVFGDQSNVMSYAWTYAINGTGSPLNGFAAVASDDSIQVVINGVEVGLNNLGRGGGGANNVQNAYPATLLPGKNLVMIKVFEGGGGHNFRFRMQPDSSTGDVSGTPGLANVTYTNDSTGYSYPEVVSGTRTFVGNPGVYVPGQPVRISVVLTKSRGAPSPTLNEQAPAGWTISNVQVSEGTPPTPAGNTVTWNVGAMTGDQPLTMTYDVMPVAGGTVNFTGTVTSAAALPIGGDVTLLRNPVGIFDWHGDIGQEPVGQSGGDPSVPGDATLAGSVYTVTGAGADVWDAVDRCHIAAALQSGGFVMQGNIAWVDPGTNVWSKAGVMIRGHVDGQGPQAFIGVRNPANVAGEELIMQWRDNFAGGSAWEAPAGAQVNPLDVRIFRIGNFFIGQYLDTGTSQWVTHRTHVVPGIDIDQDVLATIFVTSHQDDEAGGNVVTATANFNNVQITPTSVVPVREIGVNQALLGVPIPVTIELRHQVDANPLVIEETLPPGWVAMGISDGGTQTGDVISWSLAPFDATTTSVTYTAFAAGGGPIGGTFDGFVTDPQFGVDLPIVGDNALSGSAPAGAPVAYWPLNEGSGTTAADIIGGQDGTLQADAGWGAGRFGQAVQIAHTENGGVQCPGGIVDTQSGSVSLWFNTAADFSDQDGMIFYVTAGGGDGFGDQSEIHINMSNDGAGVNNVQLWAEGATGDFSILNGAILNNGQWHHVVATWEQGGDGILYVNGAETARDAWTGNVFVSGETWFGRPSTADPAGNYRPFDGLIDEVRVYDRVLSPTDVGDLFNNPPATAAPAAPSNLVADLFAGQVQLDWSDNSNDEDGFVIARREGDAGPFIDILQLGKNRTTAFDGSAANGTTYTYVVRAFNAIGQSPNSNEFTIAVEAGLGATNWSQYK